MTAADIKTVARRLLGEPNRALSTKTELRYGRKGSLAVDLNKNTWFDHEAGVGGGVLDLIVRENGGSYREAGEWLRDEMGLVNDAQSVRQRTGPEAKTPIARQIWSETIPLQNTMGAYHLTCRGITIIDFSDVRFHPNCFHEWERKTYPAIVAAVRDRHDEIVAVQRIYLENDGRDRAKIEKQKLCKGPVRGNAIRLTPVARILQLCESVEDGLALLQITGRPTWAVPGAGFMVSFEPPPTVLELVPSPDNDKAGHDVIEKAAPLLTGRRVRVRCLLPPANADWCDVLPLFEERAGIRQFDGAEDRAIAELAAFKEALSHGG
jgi:hypothetical protein